MNNSIDKVILNHSTRGMDKLFNHYKKAFCYEATQGFLGLPKGVIFIYTGFWVNGKSETDGPVGAYFLYKAFKKLGFTPHIISDESSEGFFKSCKALHVKKSEDLKEFFKALLKELKPVAHFSIERLGRDTRGKYKNCAKKDIGEHTSKLDELFLMATTPTFAIGDGGNEIGMGNFKAYLEQELNVNPSIITCDYPIIASVSNWGAYGFLATLEKKLKIDLLPTFNEVESYLQFIVSLGATDGLSGKNEMSIDGKGYKVDREILDNLKKLIQD